MPSQKAALVRSRRILCLYAGEALWHERVLLLTDDPKKERWYVATPDGDVYEMNLVQDTEKFFCIRCRAVDRQVVWGPSTLSVKGRLTPWRPLGRERQSVR